jgi:hypothetical protein
MNGVKAFGLNFGETEASQRADAETGFLDALKNPARQATFDGVRLDDGQRSLGHPPIISAAFC